MAVLDAGDELLEEVAGLVLGESAGLDNAVKELAARCVLHHNAQVRGRDKHLLEADDVGVQQGPVIDQFPLHVPTQCFAPQQHGEPQKPTEACTQSHCIGCCCFSGASLMTMHKGRTGLQSHQPTQRE